MTYITKSVEQSVQDDTISEFVICFSELDRIFDLMQGSAAFRKWPHLINWGGMDLYGEQYRTYWDEDAFYLFRERVVCAYLTLFTFELPPSLLAQFIGVLLVQCEDVSTPAHR